MRDHVQPHPASALSPVPEPTNPSSPDRIQPFICYTLDELRALDWSQLEPEFEPEPEPSPPVRRVVVDTDSWSTAWLGEIELRAQLEALDFADAEIAERFAGREEGIDVEYARYVVTQQREMIAKELRLRESLAHRVEQAGQTPGGAGVRSSPDERTRRYLAWVDLARQVRETADVVQLLRELGLEPRRSGSNSRRGTAEYHGPCPICGGRDRLISWPAPNSRCVCRQCGISYDAIALVRALVPGRESFFLALGELAAQLGLPQPDDPYSGAPRREARSHSHTQRADGRIPIAGLLPTERVAVRR